MACENNSGASDANFPHFATDVNVALFAEENRKKELTEALKRKKYELNENIKLKSYLSIEVERKEIRLTELKAMDNERTLQERMNESNDLKLKVATHRDNLNNLLDKLEDEIRTLSARFATAPDRYHIQNISEDISVLDVKAQEIKGEIIDECDPQIAKSEAQIQKEPVTLLEVQGVPNELSATDLEFMVSQLKNSTHKFQQKAEELKREKEELEKREASL